MLSSNLALTFFSIIHDFIKPESDHCLAGLFINYCHSLSYKSCLVGLIDVTQAIKDGNPKHFDIFAVAERVDFRLVTAESLPAA